MANDVTMPQLGMTQDSGIIVSWAKALGDAVKAGDVLMEVETDKATMEVEALHDGFLTEIRSPAGSDVPVGDVVAVISSNAGDVVETKAANDTPSPEEAEPPLLPEEEKVKPGSQMSSEKSPSPILATDGKILASPKAKLEARRRGVNLAVLAHKGGVQPFHYADVVRAEVTSSTIGSGNLVVSAKVPRKSMTAFQNWLADELGAQLDVSIILASFASGALRSCGGADFDEMLQCDIKSASQSDEQMSVVDADYEGLTTQQMVGAETHGKLIIYDLTKTGLTGFSPSLQPNQIAVVLTVASKKKLGLHCHYSEPEFSTDRALAFTSDLAGRLSEPLRNLL
ncbi:MAG: hypothetical protein NXI17_16970 [Alphaproteobacteria bacterium]|nr:hypothetical protein [Alphaproteobacteria bacterium]